MNSEPLDVIPLWCFFLLVMGAGLLAVECGYRLGGWRHVRASEEKEEPVAAMVASILGLLAFMFAFLARGAAVAEKDPSSIMTGLFLQSLNGTIDMHGTRVFAGLMSRIPLTIWLALFGLTVLGLASVGYQAGLSTTRRSPEMLILTLAFAGVLYLNVDLDRAHEGLLHVNQQPMLNLYQTMQAAQP